LVTAGWPMEERRRIVLDLVGSGKDVGSHSTHRVRSRRPRPGCWPRSPSSRTAVHSGWTSTLSSTTPGRRPDRRRVLPPLSAGSSNRSRKVA